MTCFLVKNLNYNLRRGQFLFCHRESGLTHCCYGQTVESMCSIVFLPSKDTICRPPKSAALCRCTYCTFGNPALMISVHLHSIYPCSVWTHLWACSLGTPPSIRPTILGLLPHSTLLLPLTTLTAPTLALPKTF